MNVWECPRCKTENSYSICAKCGYENPETPDAVPNTDDSTADSTYTVRTSTGGTTQDDDRLSLIGDLSCGLQQLFDYAEEKVSAQEMESEMSEESSKIIDALCEDVNLLTERLRMLRIRLQRVVDKARDENAGKKIDRSEIKSMLRNELSEFIKNDMNR